MVRPLLRLPVYLKMKNCINGVKEQLRKKCAAIGGDAVIFCQFQYRVAVDSGLRGSKQVVEIFAYGTAVSFTD